MVSSCRATTIACGQHLTTRSRYSAYAIAARTMVFTTTHPPYQLLWASTTGTSYLNYWSNMDQEGWGHVKGVANRFGQWYDKESGKSANIAIWDKCKFGPCRYTYKNSLYYQFDENDSRINMFYPQWNLTQEERDNNVKYLENFDRRMASISWLVHSFASSVRKYLTAARTIRWLLTCLSIVWQWLISMLQNVPTMLATTQPW